MDNIVKKSNVRDMVFIGLMTAIICIVAPFTIPIPFSPVPLSLTNLAIYFSVILLGLKKGTMSLILYMLIGFIGIPVFSGFTGGLSKLAGPTGGYLIGFIFMALISGFFIEKYNNKKYMYVVGMVIGTLVTYGFGTAWLAYQLNLSFIKGLAIGVLPYIVGDGIKIIIAESIAPVIKKRIN